MTFGEEQSHPTVPELMLLSRILIPIAIDAAWDRSLSRLQPLV
jgi:hypothetical protein